MNIEVLKRVLKEAQRDERHNTNAETRYWCSQYKAIAEKAIAALAAQSAPPPECQTEAEKMAFAFGWWKALEAQRTWVGLTDEEIYMNCPNWLSQEQCKAWIQQVEAKLKEKNT